MKKEKILYQEKYHPHKMNVLADKLPVLKHLAPGFTVSRCEIRSAGQVEVNGQKIEFQDLRVYLCERKP